MKKLAGRLLLTAILVGVLYSLAVQKLPGLLEAGFNPTYEAPPYSVSQAAQQLHDG